MQELRRLQREGHVPPDARLAMASTKPIEELYDAENDPHEIRNLAGDPTHGKTLARLRAAHEQWALATRDLALIPEPIVDERGKQLGSRYQILRQPDSEQYLKRLRTLVEAVNRHTDPSLVQAALADPDPAVRYWAVAGTENPDPKLLHDSHAVVRIAAARKLGDVATLVRDLQTGSEWARLQAAIALDELGPKAAPARNTLHAALKDSNEYVVRVATHALSQLA
jgi:uncharacterized sulfatase